jgi:hypothetical protein
LLLFILLLFFFFPPSPPHSLLEKKIFAMINDSWKSQLSANSTTTVATVADVDVPLERAESFYNTNSDFDSSRSSQISNTEEESENVESFYDMVDEKEDDDKEEKKEVEEGFYAT